MVESRSVTREGTGGLHDRISELERSRSGVVIDCLFELDFNQDPD